MSDYGDAIMKADDAADVSLFVNFLKAAGILGIFSFHAMETYLVRIVGIPPQEISSYGVLRYFLSNAHNVSDYVPAILKTFSFFGNAGVELFLAASGYGLYLGYLSRRSNWTSFYKRRLLRVIPLYYLFLTVSFLSYAYLLNKRYYYSPLGLQILLEHYLLVQTFTDHYWLYGLYYFVAIIFQLYLVFPFLTRIMRSEKHHLPCLVFAIILLFLPHVVFRHLHIDFRGLLFTDYLAFFLMGMILADSVYYNKNLHRIILSSRFSILFFILLAGSIWTTSYVFDFNAGFNMLIKMLFILSAPLPFLVFRKGLLGASIKFISYSSFVLYLSHILFQKLLARVLFPQFGLPVGYYLCISSLPLLVLSSFLIQRVYDKLTDRAC